MGWCVMRCNRVVWTKVVFLLESEEGSGEAKIGNEAEMERVDRWCEAEIREK